MVNQHTHSPQKSRMMGYSKEPEAVPEPTKKRSAVILALRLQSQRQKNSSSELEVSIYMAETSGQGGVNLTEVLQRQEEQQKMIEELKILVQLLVSIAP